MHTIWSTMNSHFDGKKTREVKKINNIHTEIDRIIWNTNSENTKKKGAMKV